MSLFQTGFAVDAHAPIAESSSASSIAAARKRKRPSTSGPAAAADASIGGPAPGEQTHVNLEKLMKKLQDGDSRNSKGKGKAKQTQNLKKHQETAKADISVQDIQTPSIENEQTTALAKPVAQEQQKPKNKKQKIAKRAKEPYVPDAAALAKREERQQKKAAQQASKGAKGSSAISADSPMKDATQPEKDVDIPDNSKVANKPQKSGLTSLQKGLQKKLGGARFRWINEQLYTTSGEKAHELIREDPSVFEEYHSGFRSQAASWPSQPIQLFINAFLSSPSRPIIADLGCGDAQLAKTLGPQGFIVLSFDLIAANPWIVEAQCTKHIPLPGSDAAMGSESEGAVVDVVVCCLSLMGHDWINMIKESRRILKSGGKLRIAEVSSRFSDIPAFIDLIQQVGFKLQSKDDSNTHFIIFEFAKVAKKGIQQADNDAEALMERSAKLLKPCLYKKR